MKAMDLFSSDPLENILPFDGEVNYYGRVLNHEQERRYYQTLLDTIEWKNDEAVIFGKRIVTQRKVAWYADKPFEYTYSNTTKRALQWTADLIALKERVEKCTGETYNSCLLNLYHSGAEGMAWHSDGEKDLKRDGAIGSLSLGVDRKFSFKHKATKQTVSLVLEAGSLLVMKGTTQTHWLHRLPPTRRVKSARINLTFRTIVEP
jgi:alkylated DNA repair dioxygenase AlkB